MIYFCLIGLFVFSNVAIVAGYYNTLLGFDIIAVKWVYHSIPVVKTSLVLTLLLPVNTLLAFFTSKGSYQRYSEDLLALNIVMPFWIMFVFLPGKLETPDHLQFNMYTMITIAIAAQLLFSKLVAKRAWLLGGRSIGT